MRELEIYPACLDCRWRELYEDTVLTGKGAKYVEMCAKAPVCKLIVGQKKITADEGRADE